MSNTTTDRTSVSGDTHGVLVQRRTRQRPVRRLVSGVAAAVALLLLAASPASAAINYYGAYASAFVGSSTVTHTFTVYPQTTPMTGYENGQYAGYQLRVRDRTTTTPGAWATYAWQGWWTVTKSSSTVCAPNGSWDALFGGAGACTNFPTDTSKTDLGGGFTINGYAGHRYEVQVLAYYWLGSRYVTSGWFAAQDCYNTYVIQGISFSSYGAYCAT